LFSYSVHWANSTHTNEQNYAEYIVYIYLQCWLNQLHSHKHAE
jgi:hypothetical protein